MNKGVYFAIFLIAIAFVFVIVYRAHNLSGNVIYSTPSDIDCSDSNINTIWNSIFNIDSSNIVIIKNIADSNNIECLAYKNQSTQSWILTLGSYSSNGKTTQIIAYYSNFTKSAVDSLNSIASVEDFGNLIASLSANNNFNQNNIQSISEANSEFINIFKINPDNWQNQEKDNNNLRSIFYFGDSPSSIDLTQGTTSYTDISGIIAKEISLDNLIFISYIAPTQPAPTNSDSSNQSNNQPSNQQTNSNPIVQQIDNSGNNQITNPACTSNWIASNITQCSEDGKYHILYTDQNNCNPNANTRLETRNCFYLGNVYPVIRYIIIVILAILIIIVLFKLFKRKPKGDDILIIGKQPIR